MKKKIALILILTLLLALGAFAACGDPHEHDLQHFEAKDPTCVKEGNIEYWYCAGCGKYFADEAAEKEIAKEKTVLAATGEHDWSEWVAGEGENCETGGTLRRSCSICGKTEEQIFSAGSHMLEYVEQVPSTCVEAGNRAHWHCEMCGKNFADQNAEELLEDVSLPLGAHNIVDGKCAVCGLDKTFIDGTPGLQYTLNKEGTAYTASGIGTATETDIVIASEYNGLPVTRIGNDAFFNCNSLTSITIPNSITSIGELAFYYCSSLTSITIGSSVTSIGERAFYECSSLASITIPDSVTSIGDWAFYNCSSLTSITIPDSVTSIGVMTFYNCDSLKEVHISDIAAWCAIDFEDGAANPLCRGAALYLNRELVTSLEIPDSVTSIGDFAFYGCDSLTSIVISDSVTSIGEEAFTYCSSLKKVHISDIAAWCAIDFEDYDANPLYNGAALYLNGEIVTSLEIPDGVTSIGNHAFYNCGSLTSITIPESVTSIGEDAFWGCDSLTSITIPDSVTSIGEYAFSGCSSLTSIVIPDSVTSIGDSAFYDCDSLKEVHISDIAAWCAIDFGNSYVNPLYYGAALYLNGELVTSLEIPDSVTSIGDYAFNGCDSLESINIPDGVTSIGSFAFYRCDSLTSIVIPDSVTSIGSSAFDGCSSLTSIIIPDSVTSIGDNAFYGCSSLTSIIIPDSVTSIGKCAFYYCMLLTSIIIPDSVTSIGKAAFSGCSSLTSIIFQGSMEQWIAIDKDTEWNLSTGSYTVTCMDGTFDKNGDQI